MSGAGAPGGRGFFARLRGGGGGGGGVAPPAEASGPITLTHVGFCGKAPFAGDFISRGLPAAERERLEDFLLLGLREVGATPGFADAWAVMPIWRFAARRGALTQAMCVGIVLPSVDRVGRRFPLAVMALAAAGHDADPDAMLTAAAPFLAAAEAAALAALDPSAAPDAAFADLMRRRELPEPSRAVKGGAACVWETDGGRTGAPARLPSAGAPDARATLRAMLAATGDPQAALAAMAADAAHDTPFAGTAAAAPMFAAVEYTPAPVTLSPPLAAQQALAGADAAPEAPDFFNTAGAAQALLFPDAPAAQEPEAPLFPNTQPIPAPDAETAPQSAPEPDIFPAAAPTPERGEPEAAATVAVSPPAALDNVFADAFEAIDAANAAKKNPRQDADDHARQSAPSESAPADGGESS